MAHDRSTTGRGGVLLLAFAVLAGGIAGLTEGPRPADAAEPAPTAAVPTVEAATVPVPAVGPGVDCSRGENLGFEGPEVSGVPDSWTVDQSGGFRVGTGSGAFEGSKYVMTDHASANRVLFHLGQEFPTLEGDRVAWEFRYKKGTWDAILFGHDSTGELTGAEGVWERKRGTYTVPSGQATTKLAIQYGGAGEGRDSSFDAFVLKLTCRLEIAASSPVFDDPDTGAANDGSLSVGHEAKFTFTVKNRGTASLKNLVVSEAGTSLSCVTETGESVDANTVLKADDPDSTADDNHKIMCDATFRVEQADVDRGSVAGTVTVTGDDATGKATHRATASVSTDPATADCSRGRNLGFEYPQVSGRGVEKVPGDGEGQVHGWRIAPSDRKFALTNDDSSAHEGSQYAVLDPNPYTDQIKRDPTILSQQFGTLPGDIISWSLRYQRKEATSDRKDYIRFGAEGGATYTDPRKELVSSASRWELKSGFATVDYIGDTVISFTTEQTAQTGASLLDDVRLGLKCDILIAVSLDGYTDRDESGSVSVGDVIRFAYDVRNTAAKVEDETTPANNRGAASLTNVAVAHDPTGHDLIGVAVDCPSAKEGLLRPADPSSADDEMTCTAEYTLKSTDAERGTVAAAVTVKADDAVRAKEREADTLVTQKVQAQAKATADLTPPSFTVADRETTVNVGSDGRVDEDDRVTYKFDVTNTGAAPLASIKVNDQTANCPGLPLVQNGKTTCTADFSLTQPQIDSGSWSATVKVTASTSQGVPTSRSHRASTDLKADPKIAVVKTTAVDMTKAGPAHRVDAGDTVTYSYVVTNRGNVTLSKVSVIDAAAGTVNCPKTTLAPKATTTCTAAVAKLTQTQIDGGELGGATVNATTLKSGSTTGADTKTTTLTGVPSMTFDKAKTAPSGKVAAGGRVSYSFAVTNTGNVTLSGVSVADPKTGKVTCPQTSVAPGEKTTCTATYVATPADIDAGVISNRATVTAKAPDKKTFTATDSVTFDPDTGQATADRHAGPERYSTAVEISKATFAPGVEAVYIATGVNFPDALAGSAASGGDGPILLVTKDAIPSATLAELKRLKPKKIIVLGGTGVVSAAVEATLQKQGATTRQSGSDRYSTAAAISAKHFQPGAAVAFVATGEDFPDALTGGPAAAALGGPILLTQKTKLPSATISELRRLKPKRIVVLGGTGVVSVAVEKALRSYAAPQVTRLAGADRYATGGEISENAFKPGVPVAYVATGANFPDALAGGAAGAFRDGPVLLVAKGSIPKATAAELTRLKPRSIIVLGGEAVVPKTVQTALGAYLPKTP